MPPSARKPKVSDVDKTDDNPLAPDADQTEGNPPAPVEKNEFAPFDYAAVEVKPARVTELKKIPRVPNPLESKVKASVDAGNALMEFGPIPADHENIVRQLMHRAARDAEPRHGLTIRTIKHGDETVTLVFQAKDSTRTRSYTSEDVRVWFEAAIPQDEWEARGYDKMKRVPAAISKLYREAMAQKNKEDSK